MNGIVKIAAGVPKVSVADVTTNTESIKSLILKAEENQVNILVLPELCITAATCDDLFFNSLLTSRAEQALFEIADFTKGKNLITVVGLPILYNEKLYNCAAVLSNGEVLKITTKTNIPSSRVSSQSRYFNPAESLNKNSTILIASKKIPFNNEVIECSSNGKNFSLAVKIGDSFSVKDIHQCDIIANLSATNHTVGKFNAVKENVLQASKNSNCCYIFASAGIGESTTDTVFSGLAFIAKDGDLLAHNKPFSENGIIISDTGAKPCESVMLQPIEKSAEVVQKNPFLPDFVEKGSYLEEILQIQSHALARRLSHTFSKTAVIGISGGLDSTLALLVAVRAMKILGRSSKDILAITMPCFGTTKRTRSNSEILCSALNVDFKEINITESVKQHFTDIGQDINDYSVTYENSQARERTQVLMDIANKTNGLVIGTGDLSELALGWATYNGDHMSMYAVNAGIPKTLIRHIVKFEADNSDEILKNVLYDILNTPVSPELLPADSTGEISQKTEDLVGPYELHDFFLYHTVKNGKNPKEIYNLAKESFTEYGSETILYWLTTFTRRFFNQQFKRSCLPDGPKVFSFSLSPRGDWKMPSDAVSKIWLEELDKIKKDLQN